MASKRPTAAINDKRISSMEEKLDQLLTLVRSPTNQSTPNVPAMSIPDPVIPSATVPVAMPSSDASDPHWDRRPEEIDFKRKGNEKRYEAIYVIRNHVAQLETTLHADPLSPPSPVILQGLSDLKSAVRYQLKIIRLADREENGWAMIGEYENDELADDQEDEKRIRISSTRAAANVAKKRRLSSGPSSSQLFRTSGRQSGTGDFYSSKPSYRSRTDNGCFKCGSQQHMARQCPKTNSYSNKRSGGYSGSR